MVFNSFSLRKVEGKSKMIIQRLCYLHTVDKISNLKIVLLLRAKNNQNCSFCDKSEKRPRITNVYKVNIF